MKKLIFLVAAIVLLNGCGDWRSGEYEGTVKINDHSYNAGEASNIVPPRNGTVKFSSSSWLTLGDETPLPDCTVTFANLYGDDNKLSGVDGSWYKGETNSGQDCQAFLTKGIATKIRVYQGTVTRAADGEITVNLLLEPRGSNDGTAYELEFKGRKSGWF